MLKSKDGPPHPAAKFLWLYKAPPKVQFFMWLLIHGRIQCKTNLLRKRVVDNPICEVCNQMPESTDHIIAECEFATEVWLMLGIIFQNGNTGVASAIHETAAPSHIPDKHFPTFVVLCCWQLWKRRNVAGSCGSVGMAWYSDHSMIL
jgi:hypothetical protein